MRISKKQKEELTWRDDKIKKLKIENANLREIKEAKEERKLRWCKACRHSIPVYVTVQNDISWPYKKRIFLCDLEKECTNFEPNDRD